MRFHALPYAFALVLLPAAAWAGDTTTGSFAPGEAYAAPDRFAPPQVSRAQVATVAASGGRALAEIRVSGKGPLIVWALPLSAPEGAAGSPRALPGASVLRAPSGRDVDDDAAPGLSAAGRVRRGTFEAPDLGLALRGMQEALHVDAAEPGTYEIAIEAASDDTAVIVVAAEPESPLTLSTWAGPLIHRAGNPVTLHAAVRDGDAPVTGAAVTARLAPPGGRGGSPVSLFDDGAHDDGAAGDGEYAATVESLPPGTPGWWTVRFEAEGQDPSGVAFARTGGGGFMNERALASLLRETIRAQANEKDGLDLEADAQVIVPGLYRFDVIVAGAPDAEGRRTGVAWAERTLRLGAGRIPLRVNIPASRLGRHARDPLHLDIRLLGLEPMGVAARTTLDLDR